MSKTALAIIVALLLVVGAQAWATEAGNVSLGNFVFVDNATVGQMKDPGDYWGVDPQPTDLDTGIDGALLKLQVADTAAGPFTDFLVDGAPYTAETSGGGYYYFEGLPAGKYYKVIVVSLPGDYAGYVQTYERADDADGVALNRESVNLVSATELTPWGEPGDMDFDFGFVPAPAGEPAIELVKTGPATARRGDTITYHFKVTNTGETVLDIVVTDPMLGGVIWTKQGVQPGEVNEFDVAYTIPIAGTLTSGVAGTATNQVTTLCYPPPPCEEKLTNTATATGTTGDKTVTDDSSWEVKIVTYGTPAIDLVKTGPSLAKRGDTITYHFKVTNTGTTGLNITVSDPMLGGNIWSKANVPAGQINEFDVTYTIPLSGDLKLGAHGTATNVQTLCYSGYRPKTCTTQEKLTNTATATGVAPCGTVTDTSSWTVTITKTTEGGWTTYTQGGWGAKPCGNNPGKLLHDNWYRVYGWRYLTVGSCKTITLTNAWAVTNFLPQGGTAGRLWWCYWNPTRKTEAGVLAGQVVALTLNVDFSNAGVTKSGLGGLKIQSGTYKGWTVSQLLTVANEVLGGNMTHLLGSISDLNNACTAVNENFDNGANKGFLAP
jgi:uncharacterized repeat protein (TIGR01451 family)